VYVCNRNNRNGEIEIIEMCEIEIIEMCEIEIIEITDDDDDKYLKKINSSSVRD